MLHEASQGPYFLVFLPFKVKSVSMPKPQLQQIIVKTLLANAYFHSRIFQTESNQLVTLLDAIVKLAPEGNFLYDIANGPFFRPSVVMTFIFIFFFDFSGLLTEGNLVNESDWFGRDLLQCRGFFV